MVPPLLATHVEALNRYGLGLRVAQQDGQCFVVVPNLAAPVPPWDRAAYDILIAVPALYDRAALDAFYLGLPYRYENGTHPRVENGGVVTIDNRQWRLVSWHYPDGRPWVSGKDTLESHVVHCKGFFMKRGLVG